MTRKQYGDALTQYSIVLGLLVVMLVPIFMNMGQQLVRIFSGYNTVFANVSEQAKKNVSKIDQSVIEGDLLAGELGGTPENPKVHCVDGLCSVDFGDYAFNKVPDNFKEFVETSGFSGGTVVLSNMLNDLAQSADEIVSPLDADLVSLLAQQGHILADYEESLEQAAVNMLSDPSLKPQQTFILPANKLVVGPDRNNFENTLELINLSLQDSNDQEQQKLLELINVLSNEIETLADSMSNMGGEIKGNNITTEEVEAILHPNASTVTDVDSAVMCIVSGHTDDGSTCQE